MRITVVAGSHRENSESDRVAAYVAKVVKDLGLETDVISLSKNPIPLWDEGVWKGDAAWKSVWTPIATRLQQSAGFVIVSPEWAGMVPPGLKNFLLLCSTKEVGHKPALIVSVSSGIGGSYPIAELRVSSYKNNRIVYIPDHVIVRDVGALFQGEEAQGERDASTRARLRYSLETLREYAKALSSVRESGVINYKDFPHGL